MVVKGRLEGKSGSFYRNLLRYYKWRLPATGIHPRNRKYLLQYFDFYNRLNNTEKKVFERRVKKFIGMKEFISRSKGLDVTDEMKVVIGGAAVMLTFGYPWIYFKHFSRILRLTPEV